MKISLARLKLWIPVLAGIVAGLCFGIWWIFQNENMDNCPFYVAPAIWVVNCLRAFFWPRKIDLPFAILFWFLVALLVFLIFLARLKKWIPVLVGFVAGLCFGIWWFFRNVNVNTDNRPFYAEPFIWVVHFFRTLIEPKKLDLPAVVLLWFIYFAGLGALLGFLFQLLLGMFRRLKQRDSACQTERGKL
jgi:xanthine/uracil permease